MQHIVQHSATNFVVFRLLVIYFVFSVLDRFSKNTQISNYKKIRPPEAELFRAEGSTDRHDEANTRFLKFCKRA